MRAPSVSPRYVWVIEDEKYGLQLVCATKRVAERELATGKHHISGYGADIRKVRVIADSR